MRLVPVQKNHVSDVYVYCGQCNNRGLVSTYYADLDGKPFVYFCQSCKDDAEERDRYAYGGEYHQMYGDAWLYSDCDGAW